MDIIITKILVYHQSWGLCGSSLVITAYWGLSQWYNTTAFVLQVDQCGNEKRICVLHLFNMSFMTSFSVKGRSPKLPMFAEHRGFQSSFVLCLGIQINMSSISCKWRFLVKLKMQWKAQLLSGINHNTNPCTLNYTGRPGRVKLITKLICFLFSQHFVTRFFSASKANFSF